ncbi:hypothetical protein BDB01DRAFT_335015 [Pilobolus umbonatus]|nr:hypothetical protein BDB01DRAFT_335015 [Pilobolus umbonatus]
MHDNNKNIHSSITEPNTSDSVKSMEKANAYYDYFSRHTLPSYKEAAAAEKEKRRVLKEKKTEKGNVDIVEDIQLKQSTSDQDSSLMQDQVKTDVSPVRKETNNDDLLTNMNISETDLLNSFEDIDQFLMKNNSSSQMFDGGVFDVNTIIGDLNNNTRSGMATGSAGTSLFEEVALNNTPSKGTKRLSEDASSLEQSSVKHIKTSHEVVDISDIIDMIPQTKIPTFSYQPSLPSIHSHREQKKVSTPSNLLPWSPIHSNGEKKKVPTPSYQPSLSPAHSIGEQKKVPTPSYYPSHAVILSDGEQTQPTPAPTCVFVPSGATSTVSASDNESVPRTRETNPSNKASLHTVIRSQEAFRSTIDITPVPVSSRPLKDLTSPPVNQALRNTRNIPSPTLDPSSSNAKGVRKFPESDTDFLTDLLAKVNEDSKKRLPLPPPISALPCKLLPGFPHPLPPTLEQAGHDENSSSSRGDINVKTKKKIGKRNRIKKNKKKAQKMIENINKKNIDDLDFDALLNYHEKATKQPDTESVSTNNDGGVIAARNSEEKIPFANNKRRLDENEAPTEVSDVAPKSEPCEETKENT